MFSSRVFAVLLFCMCQFSTYANSQNVSDKVNLEKTLSSINTESGKDRECSNCSTDFDASPTTALLPIIPGVIALITALILSIIAGIIFKFISSKDDNENIGYGYGQSIQPQSEYGAPPSTQYSPHRMDLSQIGNYARKFGSLSSLTNVVWKALENYSN